MEININEVNKVVTDHFEFYYAYELACIDYGRIQVYEDDADTNEYLMTTEEFFCEAIRLDHKTFDGQDYIVVVIDPMA